jgi:hypothetical protein
MGRDDDFDDVDDVLDDRRAELEARFQELERDAEIERLRQQAGAPPRERPAPDAAPAAEDPPDGKKPSAGDPLAGMKAALDTEGELERYLLVICPHCDAKNRMSLTRVRTAKPVCGRCKQDLSFVKV